MWTSCPYRVYSCPFFCGPKLWPHQNELFQYLKQTRCFVMLQWHSFALFLDAILYYPNADLHLQTVHSQTKHNRCDTFMAVLTRSFSSIMDCHLFCYWNRLLDYKLDNLIKLIFPRTTLLIVRLTASRHLLLFLLSDLRWSPLKPVSVMMLYNHIYSKNDIHSQYYEAKRCVLFLACNFDVQETCVLCREIFES